MTPRERVECAVAHAEGDRVPVFATYTPETATLLRASTGSSELDIGVHMGNDLVKDCVGLERSFYLNDEPIYVCPWGITFRNVYNETGHYTEMIDFPLAGDEAKLERYQVPDPTDPALYRSVEQLMDRYARDYWIVGSVQCSILEASWYLRGLEQFMMDLSINPGYVNALMDKVMQFPRQACKEYIKRGVDMVWLGDDVSSQSNLLLSMDMWREYLKPRYAALFRELKTLNPDITIAYHSCGNCEAIIPEMIDIGLDVLNPIQPLAMEPTMIKTRYGRDLTLFGAMDVQRVMPFGSAAMVDAEVMRLMEGCAHGGGFILAGAHHLQSDTDLTNVFAFYDAAKKYGVYPVQAAHKAGRGGS
jgi:uroporphyrinogen decarboxylase